MDFKDLRQIDVNKYVEKKNDLNYLSWAWAVDQLLQLDPKATWEYRDPVRWGDTVMVFCTVNAFGISRTAQLPVMDYKNKAIPNPDAFAVNTAMMRCLAKAISLHGIGLYIYAGEDLPPEDTEAKERKEAEERAKGLIAKFGTATSIEQLEAMWPAKARSQAPKNKDLFDSVMASYEQHKEAFKLVGKENN